MPSAGLLRRVIRKGGIGLIDIVAKTIYGEARGAGVIDKIAVGAVIRERVLRPGWWGDSWETVCLAPYQFSCWNEDDPNRPKLDLAYSDDHRTFLNCLTVAEYVINHFNDRDAAQIFGNSGPFPTHYHDLSIDYPKAWGSEKKIIAVKWKSIFKFYAGIKGSPERK